MLKLFLPTALVCFALSSFAAERHFDWDQYALGQCPTGFVSRVTGEGKPGSWKTLQDEVPSLLRPLSTLAEKPAKRAVLAQTDEDSTDDRFPVLFFSEEEFDDFTFSTRFKIVSGSTEQMAGIVFRAKDEKNYYVLRASALDNSIRFYKFVDGQRSKPIGNNFSIPLNIWQELKVQCKGNEIYCFFNGKEAMPSLKDNSFTSGKIGFWTKSDSVSYFVDSRIEYTPRIPLAQVMVTEEMGKYPRLLGLQIYARRGDSDNLPQVIASSRKEDIGTKGGKTEADVIDKGNVYRVKGKKVVDVFLPLRDRNGEIAGALKVSMKPVLGESTQTTIARATPIRIKMEQRLKMSKDLTE